MKHWKLPPIFLQIKERVSATRKKQIKTVYAALFSGKVVASFCCDTDSHAASMNQAQGAVFTKE